MSLLLVGFAVYFCIIGLIASISYSYSKKNSATQYSDALLGNRSINYVLTALSAHASDMSDWLFMAFPGALYAGGMINAWIAIGLIAGMFIVWHFIAPQLRTATSAYNCFTLSTYFEHRFSDSSGIIRLMSAILSIIFFAVYIAAGLKGFGFIAESIFHIPYYVGTIGAIICAITYTLLGGYRTLAWIDCFQALFLLIVIFYVPYTAFSILVAIIPLLLQPQQNISRFPCFQKHGLVYSTAYSWQ